MCSTLLFIILIYISYLKDCRQRNEDIYQSHFYQPIKTVKSLLLYCCFYKRHLSCLSCQFKSIGNRDKLSCRSRLDHAYVHLQTSMSCFVTFYISIFIARNLPSIIMIIIPFYVCNIKIRQISRNITQIIKNANINYIIIP